MRRAQDNHLIDVCRSIALLYVPLYKMRYVQAFLINSQILTIAVRIFINEQGTVPKDGMNFNSLRVGSELT